MNSTEEQMTAAGRPEIDAIIGLAHIQLSAAEQVWTANLNIARACFADSAEYARSVLDAKDAEQVYQLNATMLRPAMDRALSYQRDIYRAASQASDELARLGDLQKAEINRNMAAYLDRLARYVPVGAESAVAAFRLAFESANNALYSLAQDLVEVTEAPDPLASPDLPATHDAGGAAKGARKRAA